MTKKSITIGGILGVIGAFALLFWAISISEDLIKDPTNPKNVENVAEKMVDEATPTEANMIIAFAPYGVGGVILIILFVFFWDKIKNYKIPLNI